MKRTTHWLTLLMLVLTACQHRVSMQDRQRVDSLNERAYHYRYVDVDSVRAWSQRSAAIAGHGYKDGLCEALNNLAFVQYQQMQFDSVGVLIDSIQSLTSNQIQLVCADVIQMKVSMRTGNGLEFFDAKTHAEERLRRIAEEEERLTPREREMVDYARSELHIITSTYDFYQGLDSAARNEMTLARNEMQNSHDTAQWVYLDYMMGSGGMIEADNALDIFLWEFDYMMDCYGVASKGGLLYFMGNSLQYLSSVLAQPANLAVLMEHRPAAIAYLREQHHDWVPQGYEGEMDFPLAMCNHALHLFREYKDLFQTACTLRTLGELYTADGRYDEALSAYSQALQCVNQHHRQCYGANHTDTLCTYSPDARAQSVETEWMNDSLVQTVPEWIVGIRERLSILYSQMGMKAESDFNRNAYLDILSYNTPNRELESRTQRLQKETRHLRINLTLSGLLILTTLVLALIYQRKQRNNSHREIADLRTRMEGIDLESRVEALQEQLEEQEEQFAISQHNITNQKAKNAENRARVTLVHDVVPFLDRVIGEVIRMKRNDQVEEGRLQYISELTDRIEQLNNILTEWIKINQGELKLHICTVDLGDLFQLISRGHYAYDQKGVHLEVIPTDLRVKADESLTLFMINTLADNARKFTPEGGTVTIEAHEVDNVVEVSIQDTGCGLSAEDVDTLNNSKVYDPQAVGREHTDGKGFGFGIMNCRGIIEKYKKASALMAESAFGVDSKQGQGSRFWFRLPRVGAMIALLLCSICSMALPLGQMPQDEYVLYDSVVSANIQGRYVDAINFATKALDAISEHYPHSSTLMLLPALDQEEREVEMEWLGQGIDADYELVVNLRNEVAISALALGEMPLYQYNNRLCTRLHKLINQDETLPRYLDRLEQTKRNINLLITCEIIFSLLILLLVYRLWVSRQMRLGIGIEGLEQYFQQMQSLTATLNPEQVGEADANSQLDSLLNGLATENNTATQEGKEIQQVAQQLHDNVKEKLVTPLYQLTEQIQESEDRTSRSHYEEKRIYVQNQILDNCLSTIKHESMYFPSRIKQLVEKMRKQSAEDAKQDLGQLDELVNFYRQIYTLLCRQADAQVAQTNFKRQSVALRWNPELRVRADELLLDTLIKKIRQGMVELRSNGLTEKQSPIRISAEAEGDFIRIKLTDESNTTLPLSINELFYPNTQTIPLLIAKQILREHDENLNHPGCRLQAEMQEGGYSISFTLPKI